MYNLLFSIMSFMPQDIFVALYDSTLSSVGYTLRFFQKKPIYLDGRLQCLRIHTESEENPHVITNIIDS